MKIFVATDHRGFNLHQSLMQYLKRAGYEVVDVGDNQLHPADDAPLYTQQAVHKLLAGQAEDRAILLCGSGQAVCMTANRYKGIRAALGHNVEAARAARSDDDSNVLCLPADHLTSAQAEAVADIWLGTPFSGAARYKRRIKEMDEL